MKLSQSGLDFIKRWEGFSAKPYRCPAGVLTIGYGHAGGVKASQQPITKEWAEALLRKDVEWAESSVNQVVTRKINQNQFDALVSFTFNLGAVLKRSTLLKHLNAGNLLGASSEFEKWCRVNGLIHDGVRNRRLAERALFLKPIEEQLS